MRKLRIVSNGFEPFIDRQEAGRLLGWEFYHLRRNGTVVLSPPGGGMIVASQIAAALKAELDVALSRKMRTPGHDEIALGCIPEIGSVFLDETSVEELGVSRTYIAVEKELQEKEMLRRSQRIRRTKPRVPLGGKTVIIVDDGVATGGTMQAILWAVSQEHPKSIMVGIPVGPEEIVANLARNEDMTVCLKVPPLFMSVEQFYIHFDQVDDEKVQAILDSQRAGRVRRQDKPGMSQTARYFFRLALQRYFF